MKKILLNLGLLSIVGAPTITVISCSENLKKNVENITQKVVDNINKNGNTNNGGVGSPTSTLSQSIAVAKPKISFWNVLNLGDDNTPKKRGRFKSIANVINDSNSSIVGLAEIDKEDTIEKLCNILNQINSSAHWGCIRSNKSGYDSQGKLVGGSRQVEYYGFLYKSTEFIPKPFANTNLIGALYINPRIDNEFYPNEKTAFVRPPFGVSFEERTTHKDFTFAISHNDSPGTSASKGSIKEKNYGQGQGTQEIWEAKHLIDAMKYFDAIDGNNSDLVYMGDTNIKSATGNTPFQTLIDDHYSALVNPADASTKSSLGFTDYSEAYDRIFIKSALLSPNDAYEKYDLGTAFSRNIAHVDDYESEPPKTPINFRVIRTFISDHTMVSSKLVMSNEENDNSSPNWDEYLNKLLGN